MFAIMQEQNRRPAIGLHRFCELSREFNGVIWAVAAKTVLVMASERPCSVAMNAKMIASASARGAVGAVLGPEAPGSEDWTGRVCGQDGEVFLDLGEVKA